jgi:hypothetical protein
MPYVSHIVALLLNTVRNPTAQSSNQLRTRDNEAFNATVVVISVFSGISVCVVVYLEDGDRSTQKYVSA